VHTCFSTSCTCVHCSASTCICSNKSYKISHVTQHLQYNTVLYEIAEKPPQQKAQLTCARILRTVSLVCTSLAWASSKMHSCSCFAVTVIRDHKKQRKEESCYQEQNSNICSTGAHSTAKQWVSSTHTFCLSRWSMALLDFGAFEDMEFSGASSSAKTLFSSSIVFWTTVRMMSSSHSWPEEPHGA
jgi:hypothetical protein